MNQSRIKRIRKAAIKLVLASPDLTVQQREKVYKGTIKTMKKATHRQGTPSKKGLVVSKKMRPSESLMAFQERRKACNHKKRRG